VDEGAERDQGSVIAEAEWPNFPTVLTAVDGAEQVQAILLHRHHRKVE
jgi:hypothetical protein